MDLSTVFRYVDPSLVAKKGLNRFAWDLRHKGAWHSNAKRRYKNGPMVAPGTYRAELQVGGKTVETEFEVLLDPRVEESGYGSSQALAQLNLQLRVRDLVSQSRKLIYQLEEEHKTLGKQHPKAKEIEALLKELKNDDGAYPQQMLASQINYLSYMVGSADQVTGQDTERG